MNMLSNDLNDVTVGNFVPTRVFKDNSDRINSIDFSKTQLVSASNDDSISLYDLQEGTFSRTCHSKKYGVCHIHFDNKGNSVLHASNKIDDNIRYLSLTENKYLRYFIGHQKPVVNIAMSPADDTYVSGSEDNTLRMWDLKASPCLGIMYVADPPIACYDPQGLVIAVAFSSNTLKLYDRRAFDQGPYRTSTFEDLNPAPPPPLPGMKTQPHRICEWKGMKFSPDGTKIVVSTNGNSLYLIDSFTGKLLNTLTGHANDMHISLEASFSEDSRFVFCGSTNGKIHVWNVETGRMIGTFLNDILTPIQCLRFSTEHQLFATASDENLTLWTHI